MSDMSKSVSSIRAQGGMVGWAMPRDRWISLLEWAIIISLGSANVMLAHITGISMSEPISNAKILTIIVAVWPLTAVLTRLTGFGVGTEVIAENAAKFFLFTLVASAFSYYLATNSAPLNDALIVKIDGLLGFSWPAFFAWVSNHNPVGTVLAYLYVSLIIQAVLVLLFVGVIYPRRPNRFITAYFVSALLTMVVFGFFPVAGPFVYFHHTDAPGALYVEHYLQMRRHALTTIPMDDLRGIVSFPSFHVSGAVIITYFLRGLPVVSLLAIAVNIGMSVGALYIGGHYLSDVLAGFVVGLITIAVIQWLEGSGPEQRLALRRRSQSAKSDR
jgi:membrane-associated phospholipid phosphatase